MALSTAAWAQDATADAPAPQADEGTIVVTGIRQTIQNSIETKRNETAIVDALSADDIGDIPALSVGEAIQTITGATTHREKGDASEIALRGLGPFLSNATFNGRDATNGSGDRSVNFNQFPSELVNEIKIYKTQQADLIEGGVAGTIEIGTLRPLEFGKRRIQGEIKGQYNPYGDKINGKDGTGWRGTVSYVDQFANDTIGISLGYQRNDTNNPEETAAFSTTWTACQADIVVDNNNCNVYTRDEFDEDRPFFLVPNAYTMRQIDEVDQRDSFFGAIQWSPSTVIDVNLDVQYSNREYTENRVDLNLSEGRRSLVNVEYDESGIVRYLEGQSAIESNGNELTRAEEYLGGGLSVEWRANDRLTLAGDLSYSKTTRVEDELMFRLRTDPNDVNGDRTVFGNMRIPYIYEQPVGQLIPTITIDPRFDLNDHELFWDDPRFRRDQSRRDNEIVAGRIDANYEVDGFLSNLSAGLRLSEMTYSDYDVRNGDFTYNLAREEDQRINQLCRIDFPQRDYLEAAPDNSITSWASFDGECLFREYVGTEDPGPLEDKRSISNRDVTERVLAGYVMAEYESMLGNTPVRGNFGVRVVNTDVTSRGLRSALLIEENDDGTISLDTVPGEFETVTIENATTRVLPSANAIFEVAPNTLVRAAVYRAMSRPAPSALGAGRTFQLEDGESFTSVENAIRNINANGSPRLKPLMSWNIDAALEWYPNADTLLAGTLYYKRFGGGFQPIVFDENFVIDGQDVIVPVTQTRNSPDKSRIYGLELTAATRFSFLPAPLDGLGAKVSYNYADSNFETEDVSLGDVYDPVTDSVSQGILPPAGLNGYSKHVLSAQAYYDIGPLSFQAIYYYRSRYFQDFVGGNRQLRFVAPNETVDFRISANLTRNVSLKFEAKNVFDEPKVTYMPVYGNSRQYHYYGSKYFLGLRVKL